MKKQLIVVSQLAAATLLYASCMTAMACNRVSKLDELRPLSHMQQEMHQLLHARDFVTLDQRVAEYSQPNALTPDAQDKMLAIAGGFAAQCEQPSDAELLEHRELAQEWQKKSKFPNVVGLALVHLELTRAWKARGSAPGSSVSDGQWAGFRSLMDSAQAMLDARPAFRKHAFFYYIQMNIAKATGWNSQRYDALFDEATRAFPDHITPYLSKTEYLAPNWHGSRRQVVDFIAESERKQAQRFGPNVLYAIVHLHVPEKNMFASGDVDLQRFKLGMEALMRRYPAPYLRNRYAQVVCQNGNYALAAEQLAILGNKISFTAWHGPEQYHYCRQAIVRSTAPVGNETARPLESTGTHVVVGPSVRPNDK